MSNITEEERRKQIEARKDFKASISEKEAERRAAAELFNIDEFIVDAEKIHEVYVEEIDRRVQYKKLNLTENSELVRIKDVTDRGQKMLYLMLNKANPEITEDGISKISSDAASAILTAMMGNRTFLKDSTKRP